MVRYNPKDWFGLIFKFHKQETFRKLAWVMLSIAVYTAIVVYIEIEILQLKYASTTIVHSLLGFIISLLLVFRTNTAYDRWWEGRKQWGALVNVSRNLALKIDAILPAAERQLRDELKLLISAYPDVLKQHLRDISPEEIKSGLPKFLNKTDIGSHAPNFIASAMQKRIVALYQKNHFGEAAYLALLNDIHQFTDICGACERIKKTPIPYTYNIFIKKFIFVYITSMPFGFVSEFGYSTVLITVFTFYALASLELIAEEIEDPFGNDSNDLPTDEIAITITKNVNEIIA